MWVDSEAKADAVATEGCVMTLSERVDVSEECSDRIRMGAS